MKASDYLGGLWLRSSDLDGPTAFRIEGVTLGMLDGKEQLVLKFVGHDKQLGLNVTNTKTLISLFGDDTDAWLGKSITLMEMEVDFRGELVPAIRISKRPPDSPSQAVKEPDPISQERRAAVWSRVAARCQAEGLDKAVMAATLRDIAGESLDGLTERGITAIESYLDGLDADQAAGYGQTESIPF